jgi:hypothetical protein
MTSMYLCLSVPEQHTSPGATQLTPSVVLAGTLAKPSLWGRTTLRFAPDSFTVAQVSYRAGAQGWTEQDVAPFPFNFTFHSREQRQQRATAYRQLAELIAAPPEQIDALYPLIALICFDDATIVYHHMAVGQRGAIFVAYDTLPAATGPLSAAEIAEGIRSTLPAWKIARPSFNENCWFSWPEMETERKFTFAAPVDTWELVHKLYREFDQGRMGTFMPEFNDEFQVWDFDNYMYEVLAPESAVGYISFIPQANGLINTKRKIFSADSETRHEEVARDIELRPDQFEAYAREATGGVVRALPAFRRKQFALPIECVETGNLYGYYIDICRVKDDPRYALCQCEIEINRSRAMHEMRGLVEGYQHVCDLTRRFLLDNRYEFTEGHYSKLSFLRDYVQQRGG